MFAPLLANLNTGSASLLPVMESFFAQLGLDSSTHDTEAIYADDAVHGFLHRNAVFCVTRVVGFTAQVSDLTARSLGLSLLFLCR